MSRLPRIHLHTAAAFMVTLAALGTIVASTGAVLTKDYPAHLSVEVHGVPGYVYYDRDYEITVEYANLGRDGVHGSSIEVLVPAGFSLNGISKALTDEPQRFVWDIGTLEPGQRGDIKVTLRGTLPHDLTGAVYDLPGYVGHTAFVEGFDLNVVFSANGVQTGWAASADTGAIQCGNPQTQTANCFYVYKDADPADGTHFAFSAVIAGVPLPDFELVDGEFRGFPIPPNSADTVTVTEEALEGWDFDGFECTYQGVLSNSGIRTITVYRDPQVTATVSASCTFHNDIQEPEPTPEPSPEPTPRIERQPNLGGGLGGLFAGQPTPLPTAPAAVAPAATSPAITPPRTGDAGIR